MLFRSGTERERSVTRTQEDRSLKHSPTLLLDLFSHDHLLLWDLLVRPGLGAPLRGAGETGRPRGQEDRQAAACVSYLLQQLWVWISYQGLVWCGLVSSGLVLSGLVWSSLDLPGLLCSALVLYNLP